MQKGLELCDKVHPDLLLGTDPDCDRCGTAVPDGKGGYGLRNVEQRLRLYYGCGLMIESEYRNGTRISFTVPDEQEGKTL